MSQAIVGRIFWKEIRAQRGFWASVLFLGLVIQTIPVLIGAGYFRAAVQYRLFESVDVVIACCFAVGSAAIAFAGETEARTKGLFQVVPVRRSELLFGKLACTFLGTYTVELALFLTGVLWSEMSGASLSKNVGPGTAFDFRYLDLASFFLTPLPFVLIGVLFSLLLRDVTITVAVVGVLTAIFVTTVTQHSRLASGLVMLAVCVADGLLIPTWLKDTNWWNRRAPPWQSLLSGWIPRRAEIAHSTLSVRSNSAWRRASGSLMWKEWRQAFGFTLAVVALAAVAIYAGHIGSRWVPALELFVAVCLTTVPVLFGVTAGHADRPGHTYRLLTYHGVSPRAYWLSKHAVWLGLTLVAAICIFTVDFFVQSRHATQGTAAVTLCRMVFEAGVVTFFDANSHGSASVLWASAFVATFVIVLLYALGYLLAVMIPSSITAFVVAIVGWVGIVLGWLFVTNFDVPFWWMIGLLPLILLATGWIRTRDWLVDHNSLGAWSRAAASLVVPGAVILCGVCVYRVVQIPVVGLPLEVREPQAVFDREAQPLKKSLFVEAVKTLTPLPYIRDDDKKTEVPDFPTWVRANESAVKLALEASQHEPGSFPPEEREEEPRRLRTPRGVPFNPNTVRQLEDLILRSARVREREDKLEEAFALYVTLARLGDDLRRSGLPTAWMSGGKRLTALRAMDEWAAHPKQTTTLIKRAIAQFQRFEETAPSHSNQILEAWRAERARVHNYVWNGANPNSTNRVVAEMPIVRWCLPWELVRLDRLQDLMFATALDGTQLVERQLHDRGFASLDGIPSRRSDVPWKYAQTTLSAPVDVTGIGSLGLSIDAPRRRVNEATTQAHFLVWAALDYRREHHKLPDALSKLVPTYFPWLGVDPWTGRNFLYEPKGISARILSSNPDSQVEMKANQPFIASAGPDDCRIVGDVASSAGGGSPLRIRLVCGTSGKVTGPLLPGAPLTYPAPAFAIPEVSDSDTKPPAKAPTNPPAKPAPATAPHPR